MSRPVRTAVIGVGHFGQYHADKFARLPGSKLTAAVTEVTEMANVRYAHQYVLAVVDGIGWLNRLGDFRRMYALAESRRIDGLYALADLDRFRDDLEQAARRHGLLV